MRNSPMRTSSVSENQQHQALLLDLHPRVTPVVYLAGSVAARRPSLQHTDAVPKLVCGRSVQSNTHGVETFSRPSAKTR